MVNKQILIISAVFPPEPVVSATLSRDLAEELTKGLQVTVLCPRPTRPHNFNFMKIPTSANYKIRRLDSFTCSASSLKGRLHESYSFGKHCYKYIADNHQDIDIIYVNTWPLFGQYFAVKAARKYNIPIIIHVQDIYPESLTNKMPVLSSLLKLILLPIDKYILRNSTRVIAISNKMKSHLVRTRNIESGKVAVVQNWQDEKIFVDYKSSNKMNHGNNELFTYMYLGNIGPVAGIDLLIESFVKADLKNCRLVIAGAGSMKELFQKKTKELNLTTIEFWSVPEGKVPEIQEQADIMLLPIRKGAAGSSVPSKLPAYMFSEKPIIACVDEDSDTANAIITANCGWVLTPDDKAKLITNMRMVAGLSGEELKQKGLNGFEYAIKHFSKKNNLKKLITVINETIPV